MGKIQTLLISMAMAAEAKPFIAAAGLEKMASPFGGKLPMQAYAGRVNRLAVRLVTNGRDPRFDVDNVATQPAALAAYVGIDRFDPDLVVNAGTAGAFKASGLAVGDTVLASGTVRFHDRRIPLAGFDQYGKGAYPCVDAPEMVRALSLKTAGVTTGNSLDMCGRDLETIRENNAQVKEMEAAAVAWVAWLAGKPFMAVKTVTDFLDDTEESPVQFQQNLSLATRNLSDCLGKMALFLDGRHLEQL